ncbi:MULTISPECIES: GNAT family acetyltransferase [Comamonas]|jgi:ribosomal protein S18 acetylase RimI-like enzyme|uniref:Acetyltransferase GCN5 n=1 Tax=Comamonas testosteroni TK102 TaxID=1392005 RepID=A0A076PVY2_COMTE|nr:MULTISPECIES: GNAT family acetyltransferase [Comamonas]AIJ47965.1 acetyltransferase GCN5 [Comamonas testosteroni TK102]MPS90507.1 GNAT family acetyltransferase [Comamonas sp.]TYK68420.1 GNAT family acetyltransferase [Comamonas sp. Z3]
MQVRAFTPADTEAVVQLWQDCELTRPWNDPHKDIARKLSVSPDLFWLGCDADGRIIASIMVGYDGHRGWINYLAVHPAHQRRGHARQLMQRAERALSELGCPKLNLQVRAGNEAVLAFYESLGYADDRTLSLGKRLIPDL